MIDAIRTARWGVAAIALATSAGAVADGPVKLLASTETTLEIQLTTAPSASDGAVAVQRMRFTKREGGTGWRLEPSDAASAESVDLDGIGLAGDATCERLGVGIAKTTGEFAIAVPLHEGDAAVCVIESGAIVRVFLADAWYFDLQDAVAAAPSTPPAVTCLRWRADRPDGTSVRTAILTAMDPRFRRVSGSRLAALSFTAGGDVARANTDAARAALRFGQPDGTPNEDLQLRLYRWLLARLAPAGASPESAPSGPGTP